MSLLREVEVAEEAIENFDNQCVALTRRGRRCMNPVFHTQWASTGWSVAEEYPDGSQRIVLVTSTTEHDQARMAAGVCSVHEELFGGK